MVERRVFNCLKRYKELKEIKFARVKELHYRRLTLQIAFRSLRKAVLLKHRADFVNCKVGKRVKSEMVKMWQQMRVQQVLIKSILKMKELHQ